MADLIFRHLTGADGEGVYKNGKTGFSVSYFKKKEIDSRYPSGGYTVVGQIGKGKREIGDLQSDDGKTEKVPGAVVSTDKGGLEIACADGETLLITELQAPGKKRMGAEDYLRGHQIKVE